MKFREICWIAALAGCAAPAAAPEFDAAPDAPPPCRLPSDCSRGFYCTPDRVCSFECRDDRDCAARGASWRCAQDDGRCVERDAGADADVDGGTPPDVSPDATPPDAPAPPDVAGDLEASVPPVDGAAPLDATASDYHVPGSMEGEPLTGGGDEVTLPAGLCVRLPVTPYQVTGYHHGQSVGGGRVHAGDDVRADVGARVYAVWDGEVITARRISTWGTLVELRHVAPDSTPFHSVYGHLREAGLAVRAGQRVRAGDLLGVVGDRTENGGWTPHLHFSVYTGAYPSSGVLAGHVPPAALTSYADPIPFLERHGGGPACAGGCVPGGACDTGNPCTTGRIECSGGTSRCVASAPAAAGTRCAGGTCDGAGRCVSDPCLGETCNGRGTCTAGRCTCAAGYTGARCERCQDGLGDCDGLVANGCETDTRTAAAHCGACGSACRSDQRCSAGRCEDVCAPPRMQCGGACVTLDSSTHCGACFNACRSDQRCSAGRCEDVCTSPRMQCGGACVALDSSTHCGACFNACRSDQRCNAGRCEDICATPRMQCGGACVTLDSSTHCGACFNACRSDQRCSAGRCEDNCGRLGMMCCLGTSCREGSCQGGVCATPPAERCNAADDDGDGVIDNPPSCWRALYRFVNDATGARCIGASTSAPAACSGYRYEREAFIVAAEAVPGTFPLIQCSIGTDHILVEQGGPLAMDLARSGYSCGGVLGYAFRTSPGRTPFSGTCPLWRYRYNASGGGAHLFTTGTDNVSGMTCEPPYRAWVASSTACFGLSAPGC